jgi:hypothetical protein
MFELIVNRVFLIRLIIFFQCRKMFVDLRDVFLCPTQKIVNSASLISQKAEDEKKYLWPAFLNTLFSTTFKHRMTFAHETKSLKI